jgi:thiosulfate dehydrogenase
MKRRIFQSMFLGALLVVPTACGDEEDGGSVEGSALRGGQLYDQWWTVVGAAAPTTSHPLWAARPDMTSNMRMGADTWRCKECHGWDYKGVTGVYGQGDHRTGIVGVLGTGLSASDIVALLSETHGYGAVLAPAEIANVAVFVKEKLLDPAPLIGPTNNFLGDPNAGKPTYDGTCAVCHGPDGLNPMPTGSAGGFEEFPGLLSKENPWEFVHKARFGQPGTSMPPHADVLDATGLANLGAYAQTLPSGSSMP